MAALLAGARLVLRQGPRFLPAYTALPRPVLARFLNSSTRLCTLVVQEVENSDVKPVSISGIITTKQENFMKSQHNAIFIELENKLRKLRRVTKEELLEGFNELCRTGKPNSNQAWFFLHACGSLMPGLPPADRTEIANKIWSRLQDMGLGLNVIHYNTLLKVYLENEHPFSPTEFLATMEGAQVEPDQTTYEELISAYCSTGDIEGASKILGFMKSKNLPITEQVFNSLIQGHARSGDMESAKNILSVMQDAGVSPRLATYVALVKAYAEKGDIENITQTLDTHGKNLTDRHLMSVVLSLAKSGNTQHAPVILERLENGPGYTQDLINLCLSLLTRGYEETSLQVAKMLSVGKTPEDNGERQPGNFFLQHCVRLNMPVNQLKKYADEMVSSNLHNNPLLFLLQCALRNNKAGLSAELMGIMKTEGLPLRTHYFWPLLAHFRNENNLQGVVQTLKLMKDLEVEVDLDTFSDYVVKLFADKAAMQELLEDSEKQQDLSRLYLSMLRQSLLQGNFKRVCFFLSSIHIPVLKNKSLISAFSLSFLRYKDADMMAKITGLLFKDQSDGQEPSRLTESTGYFLYGVIDSMSQSEVQTMEEPLRQYFHQLMEMGIKIEDRRCKGIINLLESHNVPQLIKDVKKLSAASELAVVDSEVIAELESTLETLENENQPLQPVLSKLLRALCDLKDTQKALQLKSKYEHEFTFAMYMKLLALFCNNNEAQEALNLKQEVDQKGFTEIPSHNKYRALLNVLTRNGFAQDAITILKEMKEKDVRLEKPASFYYHILDNLASGGDVHAVNTTHEILVLLGLVKATTSVCSPLVMVHLQKDDLPSAVEAMIECAKKYRCAPLSHEVLRILVEKGETDLLKEAVDVLSDLGERVMLHDLFFAFMKTGKYNEAKNIIETPGLRAHIPRIRWYFNNYLKANEVDLLERCIEMSRNLFGCDREDMYFQLLKVYDQNKDWEKAKSAWFKMVEENIKPQEFTLKFLKSIFDKSGQDIALHIPEFQDGDGITGYGKTILDLCKNENYYEAFVTFQKAEQQNQELHTRSYRELVNGLVKAGLLEEAVTVETAAKNRSSNYTRNTTACNLLIAEQVRRDCLKDALDTVQMVLESGRKPSRTSINDLIEAQTNNGDVSGLRKLKTLLNANKSVLQSKQKHLNSSIIFAHLKNGNFEQAAAQFESLYTNNPDQSQTLYLFQKVIENNMEEELEKLSILAERLANQFAVYQPVTELFIQYVKSGREEEAKHLLQRCNAIVEQRKLFTYYIGKEDKQLQEGTVNRLLELLPDPFYKQLAYGFLMRDYESSKNVDAALNLYEKMKAENVDTDELFLKRLAVLLRDAGKPVPFPEPPETVQYYKRERLERTRAKENEE